MPWNAQGKEILRSARRGNHVVVSADAGTGKSTLQIEIARRTSKATLMLAFNQDMKVENTKKAKALGIYGGSRLDVLTYHGWGLRFFPNKFQVKPWKVDDYCREQWKRDPDMQRKLAWLLKALRGRGFHAMDERSIKAELEAQEYVTLAEDNRRYWSGKAAIVSRALRDLHEIRDVIDFDDMCRLPVIEGWIRGAASGMGIVLADEIQDYNPDQVAMLTLALEGTKTQLVAVGDAKQKIYGFRGARDGLGALQALTGVAPLPLNTTFRCRQGIVDFVNDQIPESEMVAYKDGGEVDTYRVKEGDTDSYGVLACIDSAVQMIISSRNSTLISVWIKLFKENIDASLKGSGVVVGLLSVVKSFPTYNWNDFLGQLRQTAGNGKKSKFFDQHADMAKAVVELIDGLRIRNKHELLATLEQMKLADHGIKLETVHSAKGREASRVAVLCDWFESKDDDVDNLRYVAFSRAADYLLVIKPNK